MQSIKVLRRFLNEALNQLSSSFLQSSRLIEELQQIVFSQVVCSLDYFTRPLKLLFSRYKSSLNKTLDRNAYVLTREIRHLILNLIIVLNVHVHQQIQWVAKLINHLIDFFRFFHISKAK
jgi:hypothetical protein